MSRKLNYLILALLLCFFVYEGFRYFKKTKQLKEILTGSELPDFEFTDMNGMLFTNKDLEPDKQLVIIYFSTECESCQKEAQEIVKNIELLSTVQLLMVAYQSAEEVKKFIGLYELDKERKLRLVSDYGRFKFTEYFGNISSIPAIFIYDKDFHLKARLGEASVADIAKQISNN
jgi:peroxiredoxin